MSRRLPARPQDLYNAVAAISADQQLAFVAAFRDRVDTSVLDRALRAVIEAEPVLGCRLVMRGRGRFERRNIEDVARVHIAESDDPREEALRHAAIPLNPERDPLLTAAVFRGRSADTVVVKVHHVAADGQGAKQVTYLLAEAYTALAEGRTPEIPPAGSRAGTQVLRRFEPRTLFEEMRARWKGRPTWGLPGTGREALGREFAARTLTPARLAAMKEYGRSRGATVNDLLLTAFYRTLFDVLSPAPGEPQAVNVSFDLRRYLPEGPDAAACNLSSIEPLLVDAQPGETFEETLRRVRTAMDAHKAGRPGLGNAVLLEVVGRFGVRMLFRVAGEPMLLGRRHGVSFPMLSNFGVLDTARLRFGPSVPVHAFVLPPASLPPFLMVGASTWKDSLTLAIGYPSDAVDPALVARILETMEAEIPAAGPAPEPASGGR